MTRSCDRLSWIGSWKKPDDSPPSARSDLLSLYLHLSLTLSVLTEANPRQSFTSSVAETKKTKEEECGGENIGATVVCSCETLVNHLTNCGFQSTPRGERVQQSMLKYIENWKLQKWYIYYSDLMCFLNMCENVRKSILVKRRVLNFDLL